VKQQDLASSDRWIMDGDLGPHDVLKVRLARADTVIVLDFPLWVCAWRAMRRGRETAEFWRWLLRWRADSRGKVLEAVRLHAADAQVRVFRSPAGLARFLSGLAAELA